MFKLFDSHTHLQSPVFDNDRERVVGRILTDNIGVINVGADKESSVKAIELAKKYPNNMRAAVGCHPHYIEEFNYDFFKNLAQKPEVVAIGECGLDYYFRTEDNESKIKNLQKEVFIKHIKLAKEVDKPLMIHCRDAFQNLIEILQTTKYKLQTNNVLHFFTGTMEDAKQLLGMGFYFIALFAEIFCDQSLTIAAKTTFLSIIGKLRYYFRFINIYFIAKNFIPL